MIKKNKVEIKIEERGYNGGVKYTSVGYSGRTYGGGSPCDNDDEIRSSIEHAEKTIKSNGDTPVINWGTVKPLSTKNNLVGWIKNVSR